METICESLARADVDEVIGGGGRLGLADLFSANFLASINKGTTLNGVSSQSGGSGIITLLNVVLHMSVGHAACVNETGRGEDDGSGWEQHFDRLGTKKKNG